MGVSSSVPLPEGIAYGYHILRVHDNSPGMKAGLEAFFDFIIAIDNFFVEDNDNIKNILHNNKDKSLQMRVYSTKSQTCRDVVVTPSNHWGGQGLMGISIRYCSIDKANDNVWHVLNVEPKSPADVSGLKSFSDYIIGSDCILNDRDDFFDLIENSDGQTIRLYVYNSKSDLCRETFIKPNSQWGGNGLLGCDIGYGYLHRIPIIEPGENIISESSDVKSSSSCQTINGCSNKSLMQKPTSTVFSETNQQSNNAILVNPGCQMSNVNLQSTFLNIPLVTTSVPSVVGGAPRLSEPLNASMLSPSNVSPPMPLPVSLPYSVLPITSFQFQLNMDSLLSTTSSIKCDSDKNPNYFNQSVSAIDPSNVNSSFTDAHPGTLSDFGGSNTTVP